MSGRGSAGPSVYREVIEISSDSDVDVCSEPRRLSVERVTSKHVIVIDTSSESELESPRPKKPCTQSVKKPDSIFAHTSPKLCSPTNPSSRPILSLKRPAGLDSPKGRKNGTEVKLEGSQSTYVVKMDTVPVGFQSERISEMQALLWRRGCPHLTNVSGDGQWGCVIRPGQ